MRKSHQPAPVFLAPIAPEAIDTIENAADEALSALQSAQTRWEGVGEEQHGDDRIFGIRVSDRQRVLSMLYTSRDKLDEAIAALEALPVLQPVVEVRSVA